MLELVLVLIFGFLLGYFVGTKKATRNLPASKGSLVWSNEIGMEGEGIWKSRKKIVEENGLTFTVAPSGARFVRTSDPDLAKEVLKGRSNWMKKPSGPLSDLFLGSGLTSVNGAVWEKQHNAILKIFTTSQNKDAVPQLRELVLQYVEDYKNNITTPQKKDVNEMCSDISLDLIVSSTLGDFKEFSQFAHDFYVVWRWFRSGRERTKENKTDDIKKLKQQVHALILDYIKRLEDGEPVPTCFLKSLLLQEDRLSLPELLDNMFSFLLAGFETVAHTSAVSLWMLAKHKHLQNQLRQQIKKLGSSGVRQLDFGTIQTVLPLDHLIKETLRLYQPVSGMQRHCLSPTNIKCADGNTRSFTVSDAVIIDSIPMHRNCHVWPNPTEFDPSRWEHVTRQQLASYLPFGGGSRICIGQQYALIEIKILLILFLSEFEVDEGTEPQMYLAPTLTLKNGLHLKITPNPLF